MTDPQPTQLELDIEFRFADSFSLRANVAASGVTGIQGPSGCGKSTLLNLIAGLLVPQRGRIATQRVLFDSSSQINVAPERRNIGYAFQNMRLFPHLTVSQNLDFAAKRDRRQRVFERIEVIRRLQLEPLLTRSIDKLSGGQKQRIALARVLCSGPEVLLLDEPLSAIQADLAVEILRYVSVVARKAGVPVLLVTHSQDHMSSCADYVLTMENGTLDSFSASGHTR